MKKWLVVLALIIGLFVVVTSMSNATQDNRQVSLRAAPGNAIVQMFDSITNEHASVIRTFPNGTRCTKIDGPLTAPLAGPPMRFYQVTCGGVTGYVNANWVR